MTEEPNNTNSQNMSWKKYLERMRYAFGEHTTLADAYVLGYKDGRSGRARQKEHDPESPTGLAWNAYVDGYDHGTEDGSDS